VVERIVLRYGAPMARALVLICISLLAACERKAPGPDECRTFAQAALGITRPSDLLQPGVAERVGELTRDCLTTPFDRDLLRCVQETGRSRFCMVDFERRRLAR
jgi:hypothetical protein